MVLNYKCPGCGAPMTYEEGTDSLVCEHCRTTVKIDDIKDSQDKDETVNEGEDNAEYDDFHAYTCPNCGAQIVTDDNTAATFCSFCLSPTLMEDRLSGVLKPQRVIPFQISKDEAVGVFRKWTKKGLLTPSQFSSETALEKITGIYVPFWLYDYDADMDVDCKATRVRHERRGDWMYTHTDHYLVHRHAFAGFDKVPADASEKMNDDMMDTLEPFEYDKLKRFDKAYLSGFYAEKYSYDVNEMAPRVEKRVREYGLAATMETIHGYSSVVPIRRDTKLKRTKSEYVLMPVWQLNYIWKNKKYTLMINGETGKQVGRLPTSPAKALAWWGGISAAFCVLTILLGI